MKDIKETQKTKEKEAQEYFTELFNNIHKNIPNNNAAFKYIQGIITGLYITEGGTIRNKSKEISYAEMNKINRNIWEQRNNREKDERTGFYG